MISFRSRVIAQALIGVVAFAASAAYANTATFVLVSSTLNNVNDAAGYTQYEGGMIENSSGRTIGYYNVERRVITGASDNYIVGDEKLTLFFAPPSLGVSPELLTLEGLHNYNSGSFSGSVSAASNRYHYLIGAEGAGTYVTTGHISLVLTFLGTNPF